MVIPSFSSFAQKPDLAQSFLGGVRIAQEARVAGAHIQLEQQRLQQQQQQAEMELAAKQATMTQNMLLEQQQLEINKAYKQAEIGLQSQKLQQAEMGMQFKIQTAMRQQAAKQKYESRVQELMSSDPNMDAATAGIRAAVETGGGALPASAYTAMGAMSRMGRGAVVPEAVKLGDATMLRTGRDTWTQQRNAQLPQQHAAAISALSRQATQLEGLLAKPDLIKKATEPDYYPGLAAKLKEKQATLDQLIRGNNAATGTSKRFTYDPANPGKLTPISTGLQSPDDEEQ